MKKLHVIALSLTICATTYPDHTIQDAVKIAPTSVVLSEKRESNKEETTSSAKPKLGISAKEVICFGFLAGCTYLLLLDAYVDFKIDQTKAKNPLWFLGIKLPRSQH